MTAIRDYVEQNKERYLRSLIDFVKIQSVSADPKRANEVRRAGQWTADILKNIGFENVGLKETGGHPAVYGEWLKAGTDKPTILCYGHTDVQPEDPMEKWTTPPFDPVVKNGNLYGRGADDNKGQCLTQLFGLEALMKLDGKLPVNVKVFLEGEEEGGTGATEKFVFDNAKLLACDAVAISDTAWHSAEMPTIVTSLRGMAYLEVIVRGPSRDLHSGVYGGKVQNPLNAMGKIIAKIQDENGVVQIPGFYDDVVPLSDKEKAEFRAVGDEDEWLKKDLGVKALWGEKGYTTLERNWGRPSCDVHGIWGGYAGKGTKTVIAAEGGFKISSRIVANQDPEKIAKLYEEYLKKICPPGVTLEIKVLHLAYPMMVPIDSPFLEAAATAFEKGFGKRARMVREGASIPITAAFLRALKAPSIMVGYGLNSDNIHSPDECFPLDHLYNGIVTNYHLYHEFARVKK
ncbi:MAG: dipeptidase [Deltaproteobacteria bacterium]|nr:dipeptidase [Deltaproteobacteria bacterium]